MLVVVALEVCRLVKVRVADSATTSSVFPEAAVVPAARTLTDHFTLIEVALDAGVISHLARSGNRVRGYDVLHRCLLVNRRLWWSTSVYRLLIVCWLSVWLRREGIASRDRYWLTHQRLLLGA